MKCIDKFLRHLLVSGSLIAAASAETVLDEVVVTAQKRSESVQDVPIAVTAMSGEAMRDAGVFTVKDLTDVNPSISFESGHNAQYASLKIRGIGSVGNGRTFEGAVGVFIDGVYRSRSAMALSDMNDIGTMEVLRGPQGTLFGKNTVAGALSLSSARPDFDEINGYVEVVLGNYESRRVLGAVNIPASDKHALRFSAISNQQDGFTYSPQQERSFDDTDRYSLKAQWLYEPSDRVQSLLIFDYAKSDANCCYSAVQVENGPLADTVEYYANLRGLEFYRAPEAEERRRANNNKRTREIREDMGLSWQLDWSFDGFDIRSVAGLRRFDDEQIETDNDFSPAHILSSKEAARIDFWSWELTFLTTVGITDVVAGLYYSNESFDSQFGLVADTDTDNFFNYLATRTVVAMITGMDQETAALCRPPETVAGCAFPAGSNSLAPTTGEPINIDGYFQDSTSAAVYLHTQTPIGDSWNVVAGLRYSVDEKEGGYEQIYWYDSPIARALVNSGALGTPPSGDASTPRNGFDLAGLWNGPSFRRAIDSEVVSGTASLQYLISDDAMAYLTYSRGYKAGAVNLFFMADNFDNTTYQPEYATGWEVGLKASYWERRARTNIAVFTTEYEDLQINFFNGTSFYTANTDTAISRGIEIENTVQLTRHSRAELNATILDARFGDLSEADPAIRHLDGRDTPRAAALAVVAAVNHEQPISASLLGYGRISASYTGEHYVSADVADEPRQDAYTLWDLNLGLRYLGKQEWDLRLFCKNCTDETYRTIYFAAPLQAGSNNAFLNAPRTVGLSLRTTF